MTICRNDVDFIKVVDFIFVVGKTFPEHLGGVQSVRLCLLVTVVLVSDVVTFISSLL